MARGRIRAWIDGNVGYSEITSALARRRVSATNPVHYIGAAALLLLLIQVVSGVLLMLHYEPNAASAHSSTIRIAADVPFGDLVRGVHLWSGDLFVLSAALHLFSVMVRRSFRHPRELMWMTGALLLVLGLAMAFTGVILPWSQNAYLQARVGSQLARHVPFLGEWLQHLLRGGAEVTPHTLQHAFGFHVGILPALMTVLVLAHLFLLRKPGTRRPSTATTIPVYPDFLVRQAAVLVGVLVVVITLATVYERPLGVPVDPTALVGVDARPPWFFLFLHQMLLIAPAKLLGVDSATFIVGALCVIGLAGFLLPLLDRRGSRVTALVGWVLFALIGALTVYGLA